MLGVLLNNIQPLPIADFSVDLAMNFLHQVIFITLMSEHNAVAGFASKDYLMVWIKTAVFGVHEHGVALRAESPCSRGVV